MSAPTSTRRQSAGAPTPADAPTTANGLLLRAVRRRRHLVVPGLVLMTLWQLCEALVPIAIGVIVDVAIIPLDRWALLWSVVGLIALFTVLSLGYRFGARMSNRALQEEADDLRVEVTRVPLTRRRAMDGASSGDVLSVCSADADVAALVFRQIALGGSAVISFVGISVYLLWTDWLVGLIVLIGVPLSLVLVALPSRASSRHSTAQEAAIGRASSRATDIMAGLRVLKAGGGERWAAEQYRTASEEAAAAGIVTAERTGRVQGIGSLGMAVVLALVLLAAGYRVLAGEMEIGTARSTWRWPRGRSSRSWPISPPPRTPSPWRSPGTATGPTPCWWAGTDAVTWRPRSPSTSSPRRTAWICSSAPSVRTSRCGTAVRDMAARGTTTSSVSPVAVARPPPRSPMRSCVPRPSRRSSSTCPTGSTTRVQEGGRNLSGGQRQRIALARALHADPDVLVLHEPTSAVDAVTEWEIAQSVRRLRTSRPRQATLIVTSSPAFLATADRVVHLPRSGETRSGTHLELREASASYRTAVDR